MTRAFISILQFDFISAVHYNLLSVPLFIGIAIYCLLLLADIILDKNLVILTEKILSRKYMYIIYAVALILSTVINNAHPES